MKKSFENALLAQGYTPIICVGFREIEERMDYRIKIAVSPVLKSLQPETWDTLIATMLGALEKLYNTPMDDLEIQ